MFIITHRRFFFLFSFVLIVFSVWSMMTYGFTLGIDFKGGSILELSYTAGRPSLDQVKQAVETLELGSNTVTFSGDKNVTIKTRDISPQEKEQVVSALSFGAPETVVVERFNSIGPSVGEELKSRALVAIFVVILCIVLFITFVFRTVSRPVASWKYGLATIIALAHDVIIPTGIYILWTRVYGGEIDILFVSALLAILGYSVHDTIVVFDRVRENLRQHKGDVEADFTTIVGHSVSQTLARSINTSVTIFLSLLALYIFGGETTKNFAFVLLLGVVVGTYSSICLASPLLVTFFRSKK